MSTQYFEHNLLIREKIMSRHSKQWALVCMLALLVLPACDALDNLEDDPSDNDSSNNGGDIILDVDLSVDGLALSVHDEGAIVSYVASVHERNEQRRSKEIERSLYSVFFPSLNVPEGEQLIAQSGDVKDGVQVLGTATGERYHWVLVKDDKGTIRLARENNRRNIEWPNPHEVLLAMAEQEVSRAQTRVDHESAKLAGANADVQQAEQALQQKQDTLDELSQSVLVLEDEVEALEEARQLLSQDVQEAEAAWNAAIEEEIAAYGVYEAALEAEALAYQAREEANAGDDEQAKAQAEQDYQDAAQARAQAEQAIMQYAHDTQDAESIFHEAIDALDEAELQLEESKTKLERAKSGIAAAEAEAELAEQNLEEAQERLERIEQQVENFETLLEQAKEQLDEAQQAYALAEDELEENPGEDSETVKQFSFEELDAQDSQVHLLIDDEDYLYSEEQRYDALHVDAFLSHQPGERLLIAVLTHEVRRTDVADVEGAEVEERFVVDIHEVSTRSGELEFNPPRLFSTRYVLHVAITSLDEALESGRFSKLAPLATSFEGRFALAFSEYGDSENPQTSVLTNGAGGAPRGQLLSQSASGEPLAIWLSDQSVQLLTMNAERELFWGFSDRSHGSEAAALDFRVQPALLTENFDGRHGFLFNGSGQVTWLQQSGDQVQMTSDITLETDHTFDFSARGGSAAQRCYDMCLAKHDNAIHIVWVEQNANSASVPALRYLVMDESGSIRRETRKNAKFSLGR